MSMLPCKEVDLRGQICPSTLLIALREVNALKEQLKTGSQRLILLSDSRNSVSHISDAVTSMGYRVEVIKEEGHYRISICRQVP